VRIDMSSPLPDISAIIERQRKIYETVVRPQQDVIRSIKALERVSLVSRVVESAAELAR